MSVLVTGGAGFIGSHLVRACLEAGESVRVLDDLSSGSTENLAGVLGDVEFIRGSVTDPRCVTRAVQGCRVVYHQAAIASVPRSIEDPLGSHEVNATGTLVVLTAARDAGAQSVVVACSAAAYGDTAELPNDEGMPPRPLSPYAVQKLTCELHCEQFHRLYGLEAVALRYFNVFGPRQDPASMYAGVTPRFVQALLQGRRPAIFGDGLQTRDFIHVNDIVAANLAAAACSKAGGEVINVGRGEAVTVIELLEGVARELGLGPAEPEFQPERKGEVRHSRASITKARELLGWDPTTSLAQGLADTVRYYREIAA